MPVACGLVGFILSTEDTEKINKYVDNQLKVMQIRARIAQCDSGVFGDFTYEEIQDAFETELAISMDSPDLAEYDWEDPFSEHTWTDYVSEYILNQLRGKFACPSGTITRISDKFISSEAYPLLETGQLLFGIGAADLLNSLGEIAQLRQSCASAQLACDLYLWIIEGE